MDSQYQKHYQNKIGSADISIVSAIVGQTADFRITLKVGELGIDESGGFKILFRTASDSADPQIFDPNLPNYLHIGSNNEQVVFSIDTKSEGTKGKIHERPWSRGFAVTISQKYLSQGDEVYIDFKQYRMQTFAERNHIFKVVIDPFATARFLDLPNSPKITLLPDKASKLIALVNSQCPQNGKCEVFVKAEDRWGNPSIAINEHVKIEISKDGEIKEEFSVQLKNSIAKTSFSPKEIGNYRISAKFNGLEAYSNFVRVQKDIHTSIYWADLHGQSSETIGTNNVESYFNFGKNYSFLDVTSIQGNDFQITNEFWEKIQTTTKKINSPGNFIAFPGYEWSGNTNRGGDRNVIYLNEGENIYRSSHALLSDFSDIQTDAPHVAKLYPRLDPEKTIVIPHVGGRYSDLSIHDETLEPVVEIHSVWGTFEWFYFDALKRGYKVGVVANSDDHTGRLGASYPAYDHFNSYGGLTAILAEKLTRNDVFKAIKSRHCYATTGERIIINLKASNVDGDQVGIGDELSVLDGQVTFDLNILGTDHIEKIEFFAFDEVIKTHHLSETHKLNAVKILYSGAKMKGRARALQWSGEMQFNETTVKKCVPINFYSKNNSLEVDKNFIEWSGMTTGGVQGFIAELDEYVGRAKILVNGESIDLDLNLLDRKGLIQYMGKLDAQIAIIPISLQENQAVLNISETVRVTKKKKYDKTPVFLKVTQRNGHMAWTSPVFIKF